MSFWERLRTVSDASRRRIKAAARDALESVDGIEARALEQSPTAQARSMVLGIEEPDRGLGRISMDLDLPSASPPPPPVHTIAPEWMGPPAPDFPVDPEFMDESIPSRLFPNSMGFSDEEIETLLRVEHFPHLEALDISVLYALACMEGRLLISSEVAGKAWAHLLEELVEQEEIWEETLYFTGAHHEPTLLEAVIALGNNPAPEDYRALGYSLLPFAEELVGASVGAADPKGLRDALVEMVATVQMRENLASTEGSEALADVAGRLPMKGRGVFAFRGFAWLTA